MIYTTVIGCDPGQNGAIAIVRSNYVADVIPIPFVDNEIDVPYIVKWINQKTINDPFVGEHKTIAYIEKTWGFSKGGIAVSKLNYVAGVIFGVIRSLNIPVKLVAPITWRKGLLGNHRAKKQDAINFCAKYYPDLKITNHNLAEAICLAEYGRKKEAQEEKVYLSNL